MFIVILLASRVASVNIDPRNVGEHSPTERGWGRKKSSTTTGKSDKMTNEFHHDQKGIYLYYVLEVTHEKNLEVHPTVSVSLCCFRRPEAHVEAEQKIHQAQNNVQKVFLGSAPA